MARRKKAETKRPIKSYEHQEEERLNNPPAGLVTPDTDPDLGTNRTYAYDPHLDPELQWAGKAEHTSFEVPTVSLHVHERIEPTTIIESVRRRNGNGDDQLPFFATPEENPPLRQAIEFYKHAHDWSNRLIAGDSLLVMNSLLEKEGMAGKVQTVYLDPPYGIKYGSNFQPFVNKRDVKDGMDEDLTAEPEQIRAFRDTWELGIHSYLSYLRDRLLLARELLTESGSIFVQIGDENVHHAREFMDEVLGAANFVALITIRKTAGDTTKLLTTQADYILWYAKDRKVAKYRPLFLEKRLGLGAGQQYDRVESPDRRTRRRMTKAELERPALIPEGWRAYRTADLRRKGFSATATIEIEHQGRKWFPGTAYQWKTNRGGLNKLIWADRLESVGNTLEYRRYFDDFPITELTNIWMDAGGSGFADPRIYVVQTVPRIIERCLLMTTDPGDLVFDPTCGSGTTAYVAEQWGGAGSPATPRAWR